MTPQKGEKKKKKKKVSNTDTLQEQRKNKKQMEFELKLAKEKEEMYEREKQLKINRLVQEVWKQRSVCAANYTIVNHLALYCSLSQLKLGFRGVKLWFSLNAFIL